MEPLDPLGVLVGFLNVKPSSENIISAAYILVWRLGRADADITTSRWWMLVRKHGNTGRTDGYAILIVTRLKLLALLGISAKTL